MPRARIHTLALAAALAASFACVALAQSPAPTPTAATPPATPPATPSGSRLISLIRNKLSANDLRSAESAAEVYLQTQGDDGSYLLGLSWVARGALLTGELDRAADYVADVRKRCDARMARGVRPDQDDSLEIALGAAIEVEAQLRARNKGKADAVKFLRGELDRYPAPVTLRARITKRMNLLDLEGKPAPAWVAEDHAGGTPKTLAALRGRPVLVYVWDKGCGDCRAQGPTLCRVASKYADLAVVPITRFAGKTPEEHERDKAKMDSVWTAEYAPLGKTSIVIGDAAAVAYGGSSTPTIVLVDRKGTVRRYTPARLTERDLTSAIELALR
jgi:cytochrome c biogenesis protein CcmG/thiol:disulfide interchange protein DsbE